MVPSFTFVSTAEVVVILGFKPVFVDVDYRTFLIDLESVKKILPKKLELLYQFIYLANQQTCIL